jgi:hypothetical protein
MPPMGSSYFTRALNALVDRSPGELIGAVGVALLLSLALVVAYIACRVKLRRLGLMLGALALLANFAGMMAVGAYLVMAQPEPERALEVPAEASADEVVERVAGGMAPHILMQIDGDHNGYLTPEEAAAAADSFIRSITPQSKGGVDARALGEAMKGRVLPPTTHPAPIGPPR